MPIDAIQDFELLTDGVFQVKDIRNWQACPFYLPNLAGTLKIFANLANLKFAEDCVLIALIAEGWQGTSGAVWQYV
jgi:hypothetical protein